MRERVRRLREVRERVEGKVGCLGGCIVACVG